MAPYACAVNADISGIAALLADPTQVVIGGQPAFWPSSTCSTAMEWTVRPCC
jgi:hypothetical protein